MNKKSMALLTLAAMLIITPFSYAKSDSGDALSLAMNRLKKHIANTAPLTEEQLEEQKAIIEEHISEVDKTCATTTKALSLISAYEDKVGPLFINKATRNGFERKSTGDIELHRAMFALQQGVIDYVFTPENLEKHEDVLNGVMFKTSEYFPGLVKEPSGRSVAHSVKINASQPEAWGIPVMDCETPARRPTGCYLAPGSIATVVVPQSMVNKGYEIRVGAHSWDLQKKPKIQRLDRVSITYPINNTVTKIANPLGGGIYIEVPYKADAGIVDVKIKNAVRSPFFSARSFDKTTLEKWRETERNNPAPWTDFESDKFMMQVPTDWIYNYDDPVTLMKDWDKAMDIVSDLFGYPRVRPKTVLYLQIDVIYRGVANFPGYPQSNFRYNPRQKENGNSNHWLLKGPPSGGATIFHELGHAHKFTKFKGEVEAAVNLPFAAVLNQGFGVDLDTAYGESWHNPNISLDQAAIMWMVTQNFRDNKPMDITNSSNNQMRYQHRGYGKYIEIANLFGWKVLEEFWHSVNVDYMKGINYSRNADLADNRILRLSKQADVDLTPLIHFWGVQPENRQALKKEMSKNGLNPSAKIYDRLMHYKTIIPKNNADFIKHAGIVNPKGINEGEDPHFGVGWYFVWTKKYDASHGVAAEKALQEIIDTYFPKGRPEK